MGFAGKAPGVYKSEVFLPLQPKLLTGVPGFVGFVETIKGEKAEGDSTLLKLVALHRKDEFESHFTSFPEGYLSDAISGFFLNEGSLCYVVAIQMKSDWDGWDAGARARELKAALDLLAPLTDLDLIAVPDAMMSGFSNYAVNLLQQYMLEHCIRHGERMAILDAMRGQDEEAVKRQRTSITEGQSEPVNGALYYPWIKTIEGKLIPPCGHVAGIFSRSDARAGVFKAPANEEIRGALDLERLVDDQTQGALNSEGINCLRAFPGRGIRVWGARTLSGDADWRYINVRRLFLTLQRWIDLNMAWANFEPNTQELWVSITRELSAYLSELWRAGALRGETADEAFYIKCDSETNPPETREAGQTVTEIGLAPTAPAEFVVVRIVHHTAVEPG